MRTLVVADDLTGAAEIAGVAHRLGCRVRLVTRVERFEEEDEVVVVATDTRSMRREEAVAFTRNLVEKLRPIIASGSVDRLFKKTDSVLRGHVIEELEELFALGFERALLLPANPSKGRTIQRRHYRIGGIPLHRTVFSTDPEFPATTSHVIELLKNRAQYATPRTRGALKRGITVGSAASEEELKAHITRHDSRAVVWAGGADLFQSLLEHHGYKTQTHTAFAGLASRKTLIVLGSTVQHDICTEPFFARNRVVQSPMPDAVFHGGDVGAWVASAGEALRGGDSLMLSIPQPIEPGAARALQLRHRMAEAVAELVARHRFEEVVIAGGATAYTILERMQLQELTLSDEIAAGVVRLYDPKHGMHLTLKPGSYPWGECFK